MITQERITDKVELAKQLAELLRFVEAAARDGMAAHSELMRR